MKDYIITVAVFLSFLLIVPPIIALFGNKMNNQLTNYSVCITNPEYVNKIATINSQDISFRLSNKESTEHSQVNGFEMICSIVAGEMPCEYSDEALKAQAVAALSYCLYKEEIQKQSEIIKDVNVAYLSKNDAKKMWGNNFEKNWSKIEKCVADVYPYVMKYDGEVVDAYFFSTSSGKTENSKDVFNVDKPYLISCNCDDDKNEKDYKSVKVVNLDSFRKAISSYNSKADFKGEPKDYFKNIKRSEAGGIISLDVGEVNMSGLNLRELLNLRSTNISFEYKDNSFTFTVLGYGHGVGMSQSEANHLAEKGSSWQDILKHFYKNVNFEKYINDNMVSD